VRDDFIFFVFSLFLDATSAGIRQEMKIWPSLVLEKREEKKRDIPQQKFVAEPE